MLKRLRRFLFGYKETDIVIIGDVYNVNYRKIGIIVCKKRFSMYQIVDFNGIGLGIYEKNDLMFIEETNW